MSICFVLGISCRSCGDVGCSDLYVVSLNSFKQVYCILLKQVTIAFFIFLPSDNSYSFSYSTVYDRVNIHTEHFMCQVSKTSTFTNMNM
jgi:hypothetical protein